MGTVRAIDISRYQPSLWQGWFDDLAANGVRLAIIAGHSGGPGGIGPSAVARAQRGMAEAAGMAAWGYALPAAAAPLALECLGAGTAAGDIPALALDVEPNGAGLASCVTAADVATIARSGRQPILYTSRAMWFLAQGDDADYHQVALWDAYYPPGCHGVAYSPDLWAVAEAAGLQHGFVPYAGWTRRAAWQFAGDVTKDGQGLDLDLVDEDFFNEVNAMINAEDRGLLDWLRAYKEAVAEEDPGTRAASTVYLSEEEKQALYAEIAEPDEDGPTGPPPTSVAAALRRAFGRINRQSERIKRRGAQADDHERRLRRLEGG